MSEELNLDLHAKDNASPVIQKIAAAYGELQAKFDEMSAKMMASSNALAAVEDKNANAHAQRSQQMRYRMLVDYQQAQEAQVKAAEAAAAKHEAILERLATREIAIKSREEARALVAAERAADAVAKARQHAFEGDLTREQRHAEDAMASERRIVAGAQAAAEQRILINRRAERELESFDDRLAKHGQARAHQDAQSAEQSFFLTQDMNQKSVRSDQARFEQEQRLAKASADAQRKYREDLFFYVQEQNQKLIHQEEQRAQQEARVAQQAQHARMQAAAGMAGGIGGGIRNVAMAAPGAAGGIIGAIGGAGLRAAETGLGLVGTAVKNVTGFFSGLADSITHAGGKLGEFIALGVGIYSLYEVVNLIERAFHSLGGAIIEFQDKMTQVQSLRVGEGIKAEFDDVRAAVVETSMATGRSAVELGNALFFIEGHSYKGADALMILDKAAKLAASGLGETDQLVRIVTGQMVAYGAKAEDAGHFFDVFARTEQLAALPIGELSGQFQRLNPVAGALKIPIEEVGVAIATISRTGLGASRVVTDLASVLNSFVHSSPQQQKALEKIGYPIEQLRKDLMEKGLIETLTKVWEKSAHDIDAAGSIFSDRGRALVGFLALVRNSGKDINEVMTEMANNSGTVEKIFAINQERISLQWQRMTSIAQAYGIVLTNEVAPAVGHAMGAIADRLAAGDLVGAWQEVTKAASAAGMSIITTLEGLAEKAFGGAYNVAVEIAKGLWQGATDAIEAVVSAIADMIASFLLGSSWPPQGALSKGTSGVQQWQKQYAETMTANASVMTNAAANVATAVNTELGKIGAGGSKESLQNAIADIDQQLLPWKLAADSIKDSYEAMLHPLERQIAAIQRIKDLEYERKQLKFEERDLELRMLKLRAEGDPVKRAALAGQMERAQEVRERHSIEARIASLNKEARDLKPGKGTTASEIGMRRRGIADELAILRIQQQQHKLTNETLLGQYGQKKAQLEVDKDIAGIQHSQFELEQKKALQPLLEQRDLLKGKMQAELDVIAQQTDGLEDQRKILESQLKLITAREAGQKKAGGGGAGVFAVPEDPLHLEKKLGEGLAKVAGDFAKNLENKLRGGLEDFARTYGPAVGTSLMGFIAGGMVAGIPGALAGAALMPKLMAALSERGITSRHFTDFATNVVTELRTAFGNVRGRLQAGDLLGSVEELMTGVKRWVAGFERAFFAEWTVVSESQGPGGKELTYTRFAGIGRQIVEAITGSIIDAPLDFASLQAAFGTLLQRVYAGLTSQTFREGDMGGLVTGPSPVQQLLIAGLSGGSFVLGIVGAAADALANAFISLGSNEAVKTGAHSLGKQLGVFIMGGTPEGLSSDEGVKSFVDGLKKLDKAMLDAGISLAKALAAGFWEELKTAFSPAGMGLHIVPGSMLDLMSKGQNPFVALIGGTANAVTGPTGPATTLRTGPPPPTGKLPPTMLSGEAFDETVVRPSGLSGLGADAAGGIVQGFRDAWESDSSFMDFNKTFWRTHVVEAANDELGTRSPSTVFQRMGDDVLAGFEQAIASDSTVGATIRMFLRSEVIAQARSILLVGEGRGSGGLPGVATEALDAFADVFTTPPAGLSGSLNAFGRTIVEDIMGPIKDPRTGLIAQMQRQIDALPKAPRRAPGGTEDTLPTPNTNERFAATGADFVVGGSGGTDSENINLWATPGERVQVGAGRGGGRNVSIGNINISITSNDTNEVRQAIAAGIRDGIGDSNDEVPNQLLNAWRTAKAQGSTRPNGTQSRGARG